jgi:hypothetical protein
LESNSLYQERGILSGKTKGNLFPAGCVPTVHKSNESLRASPRLSLFYLYIIFILGTLYLFEEQYSPTLLSILSLFLLFYFNFFSLSSFFASLLNPLRSAQTTTPGYHRSITHATNTSRSATHNPKPPPASHPRHKHLKIGNPTTTPTAPPPRRDRRKPPHPSRDRRANPRQANPKHPMKKKITRANPTTTTATITHP